SDAKPDCIKLIHSDCHPERSEGSRRQILRCAQNDSSEGPHHKVYECFAFRFRPKSSPVTSPFFAFIPDIRSLFGLPLLILLITTSATTVATATTSDPPPCQMTRLQRLQP